MYVLQDNKTVYFDVDNTLILDVEDYDLTDINVVIAYVKYRDEIYQHVVHTRHANELRKLKGKKNNIIVWSQQGSEWAVAVLEALGLTEYVDACIPKPQFFFDDLPANEFMNDCNRYFKDDKLKRREY